MDGQIVKGNYVATFGVSLLFFSFGIIYLYESKTARQTNRQRKLPSDLNQPPFNIGYNCNMFAMVNSLLYFWWRKKLNENKSRYMVYIYLVIWSQSCSLRYHILCLMD